MNKAPVHKPVLLEKVIEYLNIVPEGNYVDATLGDGGHSTEILKALGSGKLVSLDHDTESIEFVKTNNPLAKLDNWIIEKANFKSMKKILNKHNIESINGVLFDLGLSSRQLAQKNRGFSFYGSSKLDMRMDKDLLVNAFDLLHALSESELTKLFTVYGQERYSKSIAREIIKARKAEELTTTHELVKAIYKGVPENYDRGRKHPARRVFQALRIAVNDEINNLKAALPEAFSLLSHKGRLVILAYHSLEAGVVESFINENFDSLSLLTPVPLTPEEEEVLENKRSRSAKLFVIEKST
ncbi:16S rRNA (cytosine(1402)-N(4))-methyltransferase RsmH [Candidatus Dojkabacteria bacterium]|nr:16S rRNA (cytosine(1402)-N(4))-methyltransferase RsmH [Candidatus Dojkabacteria bacterium]